LERKPYPLHAIHPRHATARRSTEAASGGRRSSRHARARPNVSDGGMPGRTTTTAGGPSTRSLRPASERAERDSGSRPSTAAILLLAGGSLMLLSAGAGWRYRRLSRRIGDDPL